MAEYELLTIGVIEARPLRRALLAPVGQAADEFHGDDDSDALHVGGFRGDHLVGVASLVRERLPASADDRAWRVLGLAIDHGHRGRGLGGMLLERCLDHAGASQARLVWGTVPAAAAGFFRRFGFRPHGQPFETPEGGPQYLMVAEFKTR